MGDELNCCDQLENSSGSHLCFYFKNSSRSTASRVNSAVVLNDLLPSSTSFNIFATTAANKKVQIFILSENVPSRSKD